MLSTVDDSKNNDFIGQGVKVDRVRETSHQRAARLALDARVREMGLDDTGKGPIDLRREGSSKPRALFLIPVTGVK
jgi:hypothetical protein